MEIQSVANDLISLEFVKAYFIDKIIELKKMTIFYWI